MNRRATAVLACGIVVAIVFLLFWRSRNRPDQALETALAGILSDYRKIIVLMDGADALDAAAHARCVTAGRVLFYGKQRSLQEVAASLSDGPGHEARVEQLIRYLSEDRALHDADKLAFLDLVDELTDGKSAVSPKLRALLDNLQSIQLAYREEVTRIFSQFATRGPSGKREKWDSYVGDLRKQFTREQVLTEFPGLPEVPTVGMRGGPSKEVWGTEFPAKTVALTFDDGPHIRYTEQVLAVLRKYGLKACFFEVGYVLGNVDAGGGVKLLNGAGV